MRSSAIRNFGAEESAYAQAVTYGSNGVQGYCHSGGIRPQGYTDPQVDRGVYDYPVAGSPAVQDDTPAQDDTFDDEF